MSVDGVPLLKIGFSVAPEWRVKQLSSGSAVLAPYVIEYTVQTYDMRLDEAEVHRRLGDYRFNKHREAFTCTLELAQKTLNDVTVSPLIFYHIYATI
jgi:hypothetical protein